MRSTMKTVPEQWLRGLLAALLLVLAWQPAFGQKAMRIDIYGPGQKQLNLYLAPLQPRETDKAPPEDIAILEQTLSTNMSFLPFIHQMAAEDILGPKTLKGTTAQEIDFKRFNLSQADLLLSASWEPKGGDTLQIELRAFDVYTRKLLVGRGYTITESYQVVEAVNRFCAQLMKHLTGRNGFFRSTLAFVRKNSGHKEIWTATPQGYKPRQITNFQEYCLSPAWKWDGSSLAFTLVGQDTHELIVWSAKNRKLRHVLLPGNTIISPAYHPDGRLFISIDRYGNPDIYSLNEEYAIEQVEVENWAIDISPQFEATGRQMVFVSSRLGNPHIFLLDLKTRKIRRISYEGKYNTNPDISPDGRYIAYARLTPDGHRIIVYDLKTNRERQVTFGPGNDEDPAWGPDSYFLAFASNRSGHYRIYLATRQGDETRLIPTGPGEATAPAWNPAIR